MLVSLTIFLIKTIFLAPYIVLLHVPVASNPVMCEGQVDDQAPVARCVSKSSIPCFFNHFSP